MAKVYAFEAYNPAEGRTVHPVYKMTKCQIELWNGVALDGTEEEVPESRLDQNERYDPADWPVEHERADPACEGSDFS